MHFFVPLLSISRLAVAGQVLWDGRFNDFTSSADLGKCTFFRVPSTIKGT
jgi:hypothetical protein